MTRLVVVYDDSLKASGRVKTILGERSFGEMILKRQSMLTRVRKIVKTVKNTDIVAVRKFEKFDLNVFAPDTIFLHLKASAAVVMPDDFVILLEKIIYTKNNILIKNKDVIVGAVFKNRSEYGRFLQDYTHQGVMNFVKGDVIDANMFADLTDYETLLMFISSGFDARYFNSLQGDAYTVTKRSADKKKMKMEYSYYWLLPEAMKNWMVMPYDYKETKTDASYTMERMPMTDIAIRWTHGAVDAEELRNILDKTFYFLNHRTEKRVTNEEYAKVRDGLYVEKVRKRAADLKQKPEYGILAQLIRSGTEYDSIDEIVDDYLRLYRKIIKNKKVTSKSVIGHGDVFFANMLYSKELNLLRLIDPKGALTEADLWMDPYYDVAKLSHSVCGNYDFFNTGSYSIELNKDMKFALTVHYDNTRAVEIFREYLTKNGYDYTLVRLYEASLFLSMLPLHIDNLHKVLGFVLNAILILKEVKTNV